jgi:nucleotide-binding universal stress UspA family protein
MDGIVVAWTEGERLLVEASARARSVASGIEISTRLAQGRVGRTLRREADAARLLVVGHRARSRAGESGGKAAASSVCAQLVGHPSCPLVVVPPRPMRDDRLTSAARVVVGIGNEPTCSAAVGVAFQAARQRDIPLVAVHAQAPHHPTTSASPAGAEAAAAMRTWRTFECALSRWHSEFPDVRVHAALVRADPATALIAQSHGAAVLVIGGTKGHAQRLRSAIGLVSRTVLAHADVPLMIVSGDAVSTALPPRGRELHRGNRRQPPRS